MNLLEQLENDACKDGIEIINYKFRNDTIKGIYCDGTVAINATVSTSTEKACILAEELGHYYTTTGNILDQSKPENRKQELHARLWAYNKQIGLRGLVDAYRSGCQNPYETAEHLGVTEEFLLDAVEAYRQKYGVCVEVDNYIIYFEPNLGVMEMKS
jgi:hypothetical protein